MLYKSILVPYDKTEPAFAALAEAIRFCTESPESALHIITMVDVETVAEEEFNQMSLHMRGRGVNVDELDELRDDILMEEVVEVRSSLRDGLSQLANEVIIDYIPTGNPAEEIITYATDHDCDVIIMGSRGKGMLAFGSVSRHVVRHAPVPVLVVKNAAK